MGERAALWILNFALADGYIGNFESKTLQLLAADHGHSRGRNGRQPRHQC